MDVTPNIVGKWRRGSRENVSSTCTLKNIDLSLSSEFGSWSCLQEARQSVGIHCEETWGHNWSRAQPRRGQKQWLTWRSALLAWTALTVLFQLTRKKFFLHKWTLPRCFEPQLRTVPCLRAVLDMRTTAVCVRLSFFCCKWLSLIADETKAVVSYSEFISGLRNSHQKLGLSPKSSWEDTDRPLCRYGTETVRRLKLVSFWVVLLGFKLGYLRQR